MHCSVQRHLCALCTGRQALQHSTQQLLGTAPEGNAFSPCQSLMCLTTYDVAILLDNLNSINQPGTESCNNTHFTITQSHIEASKGFSAAKLWPLSYRVNIAARGLWSARYPTRIECTSHDASDWPKGPPLSSGRPFRAAWPSKFHMLHVAFERNSSSVLYKAYQR